MSSGEAAYREGNDGMAASYRGILSQKSVFGISSCPGHTGWRRAGASGADGRGGAYEFVRDCPWRRAHDIG